MPVVASDIAGYRAVMTPSRRALPARRPGRAGRRGGRAARGRGAPRSRSARPRARSCRIATRGTDRGAAASRSTRRGRPRERWRVPRSPWIRVGRVVLVLRRRRRGAALVARPGGRRSADAFSAVELALGGRGGRAQPRSRSSCGRSRGRTVIDAGDAAAAPAYRLVFSAFSVGLLRERRAPGPDRRARARRGAARDGSRGRRAPGRRSSARCSRTASSTSSRSCCCRLRARHGEDPALGDRRASIVVVAVGFALLRVRVRDRAPSTALACSTSAARCAGS